MKCFTKREYVERMCDLIPNSCVSDKLVVTNETVQSAIALIEEMSALLHVEFAKMVETDLVIEVKNTSRDLFTLARFLEIAFDVIIRDGN